jgi:uncharacterized RDD family membrane protein YckC
MPRSTGSGNPAPSSRRPVGATHKPGDETYQGQSLGLPSSGAGSLATTLHRVGGMFLDWILALGVSGLIKSTHISGGWSTWQLLVWFVVGVLTVTLFSVTPGQFFLGLRVARVDEPARVGFVRALARQVMLVFVVPALFTDADGRGMHDRATGTAVLRAR